MLGCAEVEQIELTKKAVDANQRMELPGVVFDACAAGDMDAVIAWLNRGGHIDAVVVEDGDNEATLLSAGVFSGVPMVEMLLRRGPNVDHQNLLGWTALMSSAFEGKIEVVQLLLQSSAKLDLQNNNGNTALTIARQRGHTEIVRLLCH